MKTSKITEFVKGSDIFASTGVSKVKVTKAGEVSCLEIPIQSTGISEIIDAFEAKAPQPPVKNILVKPDAELGKEMGITKKQWMHVPDLADPAYIKAKSEHDSDLGMKILFRGMAVDVKDGDKVVGNEDEKIAILKSMGMSGDQFSQIVEDITSLTRWTEGEKESFLD